MSRPAVKVRAYQPGDGFRLACNLRDQDADELRACGHSDHYRAILDSVHASKFKLTAETADKRLVCVFGLAEAGTTLAPVGVPWMLGTPLVAVHRRALARMAPRYIEAMLQVYPTLQNMVHARNTIATAWLTRVGFTLQHPIPHPVTGELFHPFFRNV